MLGNNGFVTEFSENPLRGDGGHLCMVSPRAPEMPGPPLIGNFAIIFALFNRITSGMNRSRLGVVL